MDFEFNFRVIDSLDMVGPHLLTSAAPLLAETMSTYDVDIFTALVRIMSDRPYSEDVYTGFASIFACMVPLATNDRELEDFVPVFRGLLKRSISRFTLDGVLALAKRSSGDVAVRLVSPPYHRPHQRTVLDLVVQALPVIEVGLLRIALAVVLVCLNMITMYPAIGNRIDMRFLLSIDDVECQGLTAEIFAQLMKSDDCRPRLAQPDFMFPLLGALQEQPYACRRGAICALIEGLKGLAVEGTEDLLRNRFLEQLVMFFESEHTELNRQLLIGVLRLLYIVDESFFDLFREQWELIEPFLDDEDEACRAYAQLVCLRLRPQESE
jgi:hypothetical protein